jgi:hypothetical protein
MTATIAAVAGIGVAALLVMPSAVQAAPAPAAPIAQRIDLVRSGGFIGATTGFVIDATNTNRGALQALKIASDAEYRALGPIYKPASVCCDLFKYNVTVAYSDGSVKTVLTWDGAKRPQALSDVIALTVANGVITPVREAPAVKRVDLVRSGGITGRTTRYVIDDANPADGAQDARDLASGAEFRALSASYKPSSLCCDLFQYDLAVSYSDGSTKQVVTWSGATAPDVLWAVISLTQKYGTTWVALPV